MKKTTTLLMSMALAVSAVHAQDQDDKWERNPIRHVLLLSIDGMHAVDFLNCSKGLSTVNHGAPYCPHLASLGATGVNYVAASTSKPSDSFPGLMSIVTGATPRTMGFITTSRMIARWMLRRRRPATAWRRGHALPIASRRAQRRSMRRVSISIRAS